MLYKLLPHPQGRVFVVVGSTVLLLSGLAWFRITEKVPVPTFPTPPIPSPNAFDIYQQAASLNRGTGGKLLTTEGAKYTLVEKERMLKTEHPALTTLRSGFNHGYQPPLSRRFDAMNFGHYAGFRELARTLTAEGKVFEEKGQHDSAAESYLDTIRFGNHIPHGAATIDLLVGIAVESIGQKALWEVSDKLSSDAAKKAALRLQAIEATRYPLEKTFQEAAYSDQTGLALLLNDASLAAMAATISIEDQSSWKLKTDQLAVAGAIILNGKRQIFENTKNHSEQVIALAKQPFRPGTIDPPCGNDPINRALCFSGVSSVLMKSWNQTAQNNLLAATLALRAFQQETGAYPTDLHTLIRRGYLKTMPQDPFAPGKPVRYQRLSANKYLLYSIGADGKDDGGKPGKSTAGTREVHGIDRDFVGDFVAGVNSW
ncbi:MAG: hypothetical protein OHK0029_21090 [Armatimonadaceae bacterium]